MSYQPDDRTAPDHAREHARYHAPDDARLVQLLGAALEHRLPASDAQARALDWLARDARLAQSPVERVRTDGAGARFAERLLARRATARAIERAGLRRLSSAPEERAPTRVAPVETAVEMARGERCAPLVELRVAAGAGRALWDQACERWVALPPGLPRGRYLALGVTGDSMMPLLAPGDTMLVRLGEGVAGGAIVVARVRDDGYVVKQVAGVTSRGLVLHSLNPAYAPITVALDTGVVLGTVLARWRDQEG
ncbi:MAG: S24 family peptidase [Gemmatimonadaceae bacterium]